MIFSSQQSSQTRSTQTCSRWLLSMSCMILVECLIWIVHVQRVACKNCYPRPFSDVMVQSKDSYPIYRRMKMDKKEKVCNLELDNRWFVPYNPYLLWLFNCHINVEACGSIKIVKYIFNYIYKGHDRHLWLWERLARKKMNWISMRSNNTEMLVGLPLQKPYGGCTTLIWVRGPHLCYPCNSIF